MAVAFLDTNVFLDFYQSSADRLGVFEDILARASNLILTEQAVDEFRRNRVARLNQLAENIRKGPHGSLHTTAVVQSLPGFKDWVSARDAARKAAGAIADDLTSWVKDELSDVVLSAFERLVATSTIVATTPEIVRSAQLRKLLGKPPTSPDKHTIGDEVNWQSMLTWAKSDLVVVTRDRSYLDNEALLRREFKAATGFDLLLVTDSLALGFERLGEASERIQEAEKMLPKAIGEEDFPSGDQCPNCGGQLLEDGRRASRWLSPQSCSLWLNILASKFSGDDRVALRVEGDDSDRRPVSGVA